MVSLALSTCGVFTYYYLPQAIIRKNMNQFFGYLSLMTVLMMTGLTLLLYSGYEKMQNYGLNVIIAIFPKVEKLRRILES